MVEKAHAASSPLADARKSRLWTQAQMAEAMGCSVPVIVKMEKNPGSVTLDELGRWYHAMWPDGKAIIERYVNDLFLA